MYELKFKYVFIYTPTKEVAEKAFTLEEIENGDALTWRQHFEIDKKWKYVGRFMYTNFVDEDGNEIYEGMVCRGWRWNIKYKTAPNLPVKVVIEFSQDECAFDSFEFAVMPGFEKKANRQGYQGIGYSLACDYDSVKKTGKRVVKNLKILGWYFQSPEIKFNPDTRAFTKIKPKNS